MPWSHDTTVQTFRLKYNAALAAHQACVRAITEATMAGAAAPASLMEREAQASLELERAREALYAAMAAIVSPPSTDLLSPDR